MVEQCLGHGYENVMVRMKGDGVSKSKDKTDGKPW